MLSGRREEKMGQLSIALTMVVACRCDVGCLIIPDVGSVGLYIPRARYVGRWDKTIGQIPWLFLCFLVFDIF